MNVSPVDNSSIHGHDPSLTSEVFHLLLVITNGVNIIGVLPTNMYILWRIVTTLPSSLATEFYTIHLTVLEILYIPANVLLLSYFCRPDDDVNDAVHFFSGLNCFGRHLFVCCVCLERYLAVVHPVVFLKFKSLRCKGACSGLVWLGTLALCWVSMYCKSSIRYYELLLCFWIGVFLVNFFCVVSVLLALKRPRPGDKEGKAMSSAKLKAFNIIRVITVAMATVYASMLATAALTYYFLKHNFPMSAFTITYSTTMLSGFVQPMLWLKRAGKLARDSPAAVQSE